MVDFLTKFMPFGKAGKGMTYVAYLMAHAADQMQRGDWYRAEATILLGLTSFEQALHDNQRWSMVWLLTHLPEPPFHVLQGGVPLDSLRPFGRLSDPAWTSAVMAYVKDASALSELRRRGPGKGEHSEQGGREKAPGKGGNDRG